MSAIVDHLLFNAAAATLLAPLAYATRWLGRPALAHAAWLIVLLRLIAPPIWTLNLPAEESASQVSLALAAAAVEPNNDDEIAEAVIEPALDVVAAEAIPLPSIDIRQMFIGGWVAIGAGWLALVAMRLHRFSRVLRRSGSVSSDIQELVGKLSRRLGLKRPPRVVEVPGRLSPCVWALANRPVLILPEGWLDGMGRLSQAAVLVHELAHLKRGDHWIRRLEMFVTAIFWWHPVVWLAQRELREAEELCCDGWVIATLPAARRAYADALVDTVDFLATACPALPPLASGIGEVRELKRRLTMILQSRPAFRSGKAGAAIALGLGMMLLPIGFARSQATDDRPKERPPAEDRRENPPQRDEAGQPPPPRRDGDGPPGDRRPRRDNDDREAPRASIDPLKKEAAETKKQLAEAYGIADKLRRRVEVLESRLAARERGDDRRPDGPPSGRGDGDRRPNADRPRDGGGPPVGRGDGPVDRPRRPDAGRPRDGDGSPPGGRGEGRGDGPRVGGPPPGDAPRAPGGPGRFGGGGTSPAPAAGPARRVEDLEKQVEMLKRELEDMRRAMRRSRENAPQID